MDTLNLVRGGFQTIKRLTWIFVLIFQRGNGWLFRLKGNEITKEGAVSFIF